jgi:hypothetical protein
MIDSIVTTEQATAVLDQMQAEGLDKQNLMHVKQNKAA